MEGNLPTPNVPAPVDQAAVPVPNMDGQDTQSEASEADSSESDIGDEDGWESGESFASLVIKHYSNTHSNCQYTHNYLFNPGKVRY